MGTITSYKQRLIVSLTLSSENLNLNSKKYLLGISYDLWNQELGVE